MKISNANGSLTDINRNVSHSFSLFLQIDDVVINRISPRQEEDVINIHLTSANDANVLDVNARVQNLHGVCTVHRTPCLSSAHLRGDY